MYNSLMKNKLRENISDNRLLTMRSDNILLSEMKKLILLMLFSGLFISMRVHAQFAKGTLMLGTTLGSTGYSSANSDYGYDVGTVTVTQKLQTEPPTEKYRISLPGMRAQVWA